MGTHRFKVFGFLQLVFKSGRTSTNGGTMDDAEQPWESVHGELQRSRLERLPGKRSEACRGGVAECPFRARVLERSPISDEAVPRTTKVTLALPDGLDWAPGDRLMVLPPNPDDDVNELLRALHRDGSETIQLDKKWAAFFEHSERVVKRTDGAAVRKVALSEMLRFAVLRPLGLEEVLALRSAMPNSTTSTADAIDVLLRERPSWPAPITLAALIYECFSRAPPALGDEGVCQMLRPQKLRCYSISNAPPTARPQPIGIAHPTSAPVEARVELTVTRQDFDAGASGVSTRPGLASGYLNPPPPAAGDGMLAAAKPSACTDATVMVGVQQPLQFSLPSARRPIVLFAAGSGVGPFRAFLQAREAQAVETSVQSENWLLFGCRDESALLYRSEWDSLLRRGKLRFKPFITFSRDHGKRVEFGPGGLTVAQGASRGRYVADMLEHDSVLAGSLVELLVPLRMGGRGGSFFVCGSVPFFQGLMNRLRHELARFGSDATSLLEEAFSERRFCIEVFGSAKRLGPTEKTAGELSHPSTRSATTPGATGIPVIWQSEMCTHNACGADVKANPLWFAVSGSVYDVQSFVDTHPGGVRIVADVSGMDATKAFRLVAHDVNNEVMGWMASHHIGTLREVSSAALRGTRLHATRVAAKQPWRIPELCDLARRTVYSWVELQNSFVNDLNSIGAMGDSVKTKVVWQRGVSMQDVRPLITFCNRVLQLFEASGVAAQACETAEHMRTLACEAIDRDSPRDLAKANGGVRRQQQTGDGTCRPWRDDLKDIDDYVLIMRSLSYTLESTTSVAAQMTLQSKIDMLGVHANLLACAKAGVMTLGAIKNKLIAVLRGLEGLLREAERRTAVNAATDDDGELSGTQLAGHLHACLDVPTVIDRLIGRGFCTAVITQLDPVLLEAAATSVAAGGNAQRASTLIQLRALHLERTGLHSVPSFEGDDMLQAELAKIDAWMMMGQVRTLVAARRIARHWRVHVKDRRGPGGMEAAVGSPRRTSRLSALSPRNAYQKIKSQLWRADSDPQAVA